MSRYQKWDTLRFCARGNFEISDRDVSRQIALEKRDSEISFVCAKKENNSGLLNSAVFKLPADNGSRCSVEESSNQ